MPEAKVFDIATGKPKKTTDEVYEEFYKQQKGAEEYHQQLNWLLQDAAAAGLRDVYKTYQKEIEKQKGKDSAKKFLIPHLLKDKSTHKAIADKTLNYMGEFSKQMWGAEFEKLDDYAKDHITQALGGIDKNKILKIIGDAKQDYAPAVLTANTQDYLDSLKKNLLASAYALIQPEHYMPLAKKMELNKQFDDLKWVEKSNKETIGSLLTQYDKGKGTITPKQWHGSPFEAYLKKDLRSEDYSIMKKYDLKDQKKAA